MLVAKNKVWKPEYIKMSFCNREAPKGFVFEILSDGSAAIWRESSGFSVAFMKQGAAKRRAPRRDL